MKRTNIYPLTLLFSSLLLLFSACTSSLNKTTYHLDLCVAVERGDSYALLLDKGETIYPEKASQEVEIGQRYRVHYTLMDESEGIDQRADILEIFPIETSNLIPRVLGGSSTKERTPVEVERIWIGGNYLNATFSFMTSDAGILHTVELVRNSFSGNVLYLDLMHYDNGDAHEYLKTTTVSFPLSSIWEYNKAENIGIRVIESEMNNAVMNTYIVAGGKE